MVLRQARWEVLPGPALELQAAPCPVPLAPAPPVPSPTHPSKNYKFRTWLVKSTKNNDKVILDNYYFSFILIKLMIFPKLKKAIKLRLMFALSIFKALSKSHLALKCEKQFTVF